MMHCQPETVNAARSLQDWLSWQESLHFSAIDLGLDRVRRVAERLDLLQAHCPVITVAGTNGKGSTVALLTSLLTASGYQVGTYTSPHILRYNERVTLNTQPVSDELLCAAFTAIDGVRGDISLTFFEFGTLAAMWVFRQAAVDVVVLEVGLGGRLDATNVWDADAAIITAIGIDHIEWLGDSRELIGAEKAGIARAGKPLICGDPNPPASIAALASKLGAHLFQLGLHFMVEMGAGRCFSVNLNPNLQPSDSDLSAGSNWVDLPLPALEGDVQALNAACALMALRELQSLLPLGGRAALEAGLSQVSLAGRLQKLQNHPDVWVDVAHNPHAAENLAVWLKKNPVEGHTYVIFSILSDKDIAGVITPLLPYVDEWHLFPLDSLRAMPLDVMQSALHACHVTRHVAHDSFPQAWQQLGLRLNVDDRVVIFGSFLVVSSVLDGIL